MKVLTEADLRIAKLSGTEKEYHVPEGTFVTATAREYLRDRGIRLVSDKNSDIGKACSPKPEEMTHLRGNFLVAKTHPRIALRGGLDFLQARVLLMQVKYGENQKLRQDLDSVVRFLRTVLAAEVKEEACGEPALFGLGQEQIKKMSHHMREYFGMDHPIPDCFMGETALDLNLLRTQVRQVELAAAHAFSEKDELGVLRNLNRLSSGIYVLFCRCLTGYYGNKESRERNEEFHE